ncbi:Hypothetical protein SCLAV_p1437 (plasmid) [Streptomyces clavuligerus]|uniref:Secreted protein n=2 Tax=Streptomyces clavuligerus TaxID=1901 RepID=D5SLX6_STRCL|nr:Hypothetical protein SCLAV_p1437 [Streptomyces clavuligerus]
MCARRGRMMKTISTGVRGAMATLLCAVAMCGLTQGQAVAVENSYADRAPIAVAESQAIGEASVFCRAGWHATGGGFALTSGYVYTTASGPAFEQGSSVPRGWRAQVRRNPGTPNLAIRNAGYVNVICAKDA